YGFRERIPRNCSRLPADGGEYRRPARPAAVGHHGSVVDPARRARVAHEYRPRSGAPRRRPRRRRSHLRALTDSALNRQLPVTAFSWRGGGAAPVWPAYSLTADAPGWFGMSS